MVSFSIFRSMIQISFRVLRNCKYYIGVGWYCYLGCLESLKVVLMLDFGVYHGSCRNCFVGVFQKFICENTSIPSFGNELPKWSIIEFFCLFNCFAFLLISIVFRNMAGTPARIRQGRET